jgi:NADPH:quinone reductase-like Zn-dependent oxidoreductase
MPQTMRAMVLTGYGGFDRLEYRTDVPVPQPQSGEVLIRVGACGVNNTDLWTREGAYGADAQAAWQGSAFVFPRIQGADIVGTVVAVGTGVDASRLGQRVMVNPTLYSDTAVGGGLFDASYLGSERDGGFAQFVCVPGVNAHAIESPLSDAALATFMTSYLTAEHMLNRAQLAQGETIAITGASGGVGSALVQLARIRGARVLAIIGRGKEQHLAALGVEAFVFRDAPDLAAALLREAGQGIDVVADTVAGAQVAPLLEALRVGGRYVTAGAIAGALVTLDWRRLYLKHLSLLGATMGTQDESRQIVAHVASGALRPLLSATFPLADMVQAQQAFQAKTHFGKLAIVP